MLFPPQRPSTIRPRHPLVRKFLHANKQPSVHAIRLGLAPKFLFYRMYIASSCLAYLVPESLGVLEDVSKLSTAVTRMDVYMVSERERGNSDLLQNGPRSGSEREYAGHGVMLLPVMDDDRFGVFPKLFSVSRRVFSANNGTIALRMKKIDGLQHILREATRSTVFEYSEPVESTRSKEKRR